MFGRGKFPFSLKKQHFFCIVLMVMTVQVHAQGVGINTDGTAPDGSALLDVKSPASGNQLGMLIPRVSLATLPALTAFPGTGPATYLQLVNTNASYVSPLNSFYNKGIGMYMNFDTPASPVWRRFLTSADSTLFWGLRGNAGTNPANDFIGTTDNADFIIRTGSGGTMATRRRITIPFSASTGDIIIENVRALQLLPGSFGAPSLRFGTTASSGISASDPSTGGNIAITYGGASSVSGYLFHTTGMTISTGGSTYPSPPQANTRLDVAGSIYSRDQIVYSRGHFSGTSGEETPNQERTGNVKRYWSTSFSGNAQSVPFYTEANLLQFRLTRVADSIFIQARKYGSGDKDFISNTLTADIVTLPGAGSAYGAWTRVTDPLLTGISNQYEVFFSSRENGTGGNNLDPFYKITIFFNGKNGSTDHMRILLEAFYNH